MYGNELIMKNVLRIWNEAKKASNPNTSWIADYTSKFSSSGAANATTINKPIFNEAVICVDETRENI